MENKPVKVIIDTNLWISFLITNSYKTLDRQILEHKIKIILSDELLNEFIEVIKRPKLKKYFDEVNVKRLLELFETYALFIMVESKIDKCRDKKDNFLLSLAVDSIADYLITGDKDLLSLKKINQTEIITMKDFLWRLKY